jgi:hypothetical protein
MPHEIEPQLNGRGHAGVVSPPPASPEEAAAIVAALQRFMRDHAAAPASRAPGGASDGWRRVAALEAVEREPHDDPGNPWINT